MFLQLAAIVLCSLISPSLAIASESEKPKESRIISILVDNPGDRHTLEEAVIPILRAQIEAVIAAFTQLDHRIFAEQFKVAEIPLTDLAHRLEQGERPLTLKEMLILMQGFEFVEFEYSRVNVPTPLVSNIYRKRLDLRAKFVNTEYEYSPNSPAEMLVEVLANTFLSSEDARLSVDVTFSRVLLTPLATLFLERLNEREPDRFHTLRFEFLSEQTCSGMLKHVSTHPWPREIYEARPRAKSIEFRSQDLRKPRGMGMGNQGNMNTLRLKKPDQRL